MRPYLKENGLPTDVEFLAVSTGADSTAPNYPPSSWLVREGWAVPTIVDDRSASVAQAFGLNAYPFWVAVGADGTIQFRATGGIPVESIDGVLAELADS